MNRRPDNPLIKKGYPLTQESLSHSIPEDGKWSFFILLAYFAILLTLVQQFPVIRSFAYQWIRLLLYGLFGGLSFYSLIHMPYHKTPGVFKGLFITIFITASLFFFLNIYTGGLSNTINYTGVSELFIPLGILVTSFSQPINDRQFKFLVYLYSLLAAVMGISLVYYYGGGWAVKAQYIVSGKNQIGPIIAIASILLLYRFLLGNQSTSHFSKVFSFLLVSFLIASLIVLRNRNGLLSLSVVSLLMIFDSFRDGLKTRSILIFVFLCVCLILLGYLGSLSRLIQPLINSFTLNYEVGDFESLSAGRLSVYISSLNFLKENPFWGQIFASFKFQRIPHNFILNKLVNYGILGSLPMIVFYLYLWCFSLREFCKGQNKFDKSLINSTPYLLVFTLLTSIFEYSPPYGPGVSQIMVWFCFGQYLKRKI